MVLYCTDIMISEFILEFHESNARDENIKSYEYDEYQPITDTQLNNGGEITITTGYQFNYCDQIVETQRKGVAPSPTNW